MLARLTNIMSAPFDGHAIYARDDYERVSKYFASRTACEEAFEETVKKRGRPIEDGLGSE